jgi:hypothetical protein
LVQIEHNTLHPRFVLDVGRLVCLVITKTGRGRRGTGTLGRGAGLAVTAAEVR